MSAGRWVVVYQDTNGQTHGYRVSRLSHARSLARTYRRGVVRRYRVRDWRQGPPPRSVMTTVTSSTIDLLYSWWAAREFQDHVLHLALRKVARR